MLAALNDVVESPSSNGIVKAIKLAYQEVNRTLERKLVIHFVIYYLTTQKKTHTHMCVCVQRLLVICYRRFGTTFRPI